MIFGVGTDILEISRVERLVNFSEDGSTTKFLNRIYTDNERQQALTREGKKKVSFYATRFAAKEAVAKAIGLGISSGVSFTEIEIYNNDDGKPCVHLMGKTKDILDNLTKNTGYNIFLSISDCDTYATATATIEV